MTIKWEDSYSVGVSHIDEQHKIFFGILNELNESVFAMKSQDVLGKIFKELSDYSNYHFDTEEKYFADFNYDGAQPHIAEHKNYIKRLGEIEAKIGADETKTALELIDFMEDWMVHHIDVMDKGYTKCFQDHGLK